MKTVAEPTAKPSSSSTDGTAAGKAERSPATRIQSVARASQVLLWVADQPHGATAKEVAAAHGLAIATTYHLLNTLVDEGFLAKDLHRRYILGRSAAILAEAHLRSKAVPDVLLSGLRELVRRTEETAYLADWGENDIRVLASVEGRQVVRVAEVGSGTYEHGHARANGKVLLAYAPPEIREAYLRTHPLVPLTERTIVSPRDFAAELDAIRERGYAYDDQEFAPGLSCVAAPILLHDHIVAALGVSVPSERFEQNKANLTSTLLEVVASSQAGIPA